MFGLRESTLLNTITVKMSVSLGCQHGVYAMSFAASVTSYYIHYVMKRVTSVIYMWTLYRYVSLRDYMYLEVCSFQLVLVLIFYCVLTCLHDAKTKKHSHTTCFYYLEYDVISQLRHNYTKDFFVWRDSNILPKYSKSLTVSIQIGFINHIVRNMMNFHCAKCLLNSTKYGY